MTRLPAYAIFDEQGARKNRSVQPAMNRSKERAVWLGKPSLLYWSVGETNDANKAFISWVMGIEYREHFSCSQIK
jgi:hypothetical protein